MMMPESRSHGEIAILAPPFKRLPVHGYGAVERVAVGRALALKRLGFAITVVGPTDGLEGPDRVIPIRLLRSRALERSLSSVTAQRLRWLTSATPYALALDYWDLKLPENTVAIFNDAFRNDLWIPYLMSRRLGMARTINMLHGHVNWNNPLYQALSPMSRKMMFGCLNLAMTQWMQRLGLHATYLPNGTEIPPTSEVQLNHDDYLVHLGRVDRIKAPHLAVRVAQAAGVPIKLVGPLQDPAYFREHVQPLLGPQVEYLGELGQEAARSQLRSARALVYVGTYNDPQPGAVLESLALGVPVLGIRPSRFSGFHDAITDGVNGIVADSPEGLASRLDLVDGLNRLGIHRAASSTWDWNAVVRRYYLPALAALGTGH